MQIEEKVPKKGSKPHMKHIISPLIYDLITKLGSEYETLKIVSKVMHNVSIIEKYAIDSEKRFYREIAYDAHFVECTGCKNEEIDNEILEFLLKKNGVYVRNNIIKIFSLIPYDTQLMEYNTTINNEKIILPILSPLNDKIIGALKFEGEGMYVSGTEKEDVMGMLTFITSVSRMIAINNDYERDELVREVKNRRSIKKRLNFNISSKIKRNEELWFLMIDIDHFKKINDNYGHKIGDIILQRVGKIIVDNVRTDYDNYDKDEVFRYGGEEFCIIVKGNRNIAKEIGERIKWFMAEKPLYNIDGNEVYITCSIGMCEGTQIVKNRIKNGESEEEALKNGINELIKKADDALYIAKRNGRNELIEM